jgi:hypothetical protein
MITALPVFILKGHYPAQGLPPAAAGGSKPAEILPLVPVRFFPGCRFLSRGVVECYKIVSAAEIAGKLCLKLSLCCPMV